MANLPVVPRFKISAEASSRTLLAPKIFEGSKPGGRQLDWFSGFHRLRRRGKDESVPACSPQRHGCQSGGEAHSETPVSTADDPRPRALPVATRIRDASLTVCAVRALVPGLGLRDLKTACLNAAWASTGRLSAKLVMRGNILPRHEVFNEFGTRYRVDCFVEDR